MSLMRHAAWAPATIVFAYVIAAKVFNAYILFPALDMPTHFFGGMAITYFFLAAVAHAQTLVGHVPRPVQLALALGLTALAAIVWEFFEFLSDLAVGTKMNLGVPDTIADLFFGLFGGLVMICVAAAIPRIGQASAGSAMDDP